MTNLTIKFAGTNINTVTYHATGDNTGDHGQFITTKIGNVPCPITLKAVPYQEVMEQVENIPSWGVNFVKFNMKDGSVLELVMSERMKKQVGRVNTTGVGILESYFRVFSKLEDPVVTKEEFDAKRKAAAKSTDTAAKSVAPRRTTKKSSITDTDLAYIMEQVEAKFPNGTKFKNKDLAPLVADKFTARQTPSRLKKLVDAGQLQCDTASPKNYWLA